MSEPKIKLEKRLADRKAKPQNWASNAPVKQWVQKGIYGKKPPKTGR